MSGTVISGNTDAMRQSDPGDRSAVTNGHHGYPQSDDRLFSPWTEDFRDKTLKLLEELLF